MVIGTCRGCRYVQIVFTSRPSTHIHPHPPRTSSTSLCELCGGSWFGPTWENSQADPSGSLSSLSWLMKAKDELSNTSYDWVSDHHFSCRNGTWIGLCKSLQYANSWQVDVEKCTYIFVYSTSADCVKQWLALHGRTLSTLYKNIIWIAQNTLACVVVFHSSPTLRASAKPLGDAQKA